VNALRSPARDLPILWKLLLPFLTLLLVVGSIGAFIIVRDRAERADASTREQVALRTVEARSLLHDRELDLLESARYASNVEGMPDAVRGADQRRVETLLRSVLALKSSLDVVAVTDGTGRALVDVVRRGRDDGIAGAGTDWSAASAVQRVLASGGERDDAAIARIGDRTLLVVAAPICVAPTPCALVGVAVTAVDASTLVHSIADASAADVALFDDTGRPAASTSADFARSIGAAARATRTIRYERSHLGGRDVMTGQTGFSLAGRPAGSVAVALARDRASGSGVAWRLAALLVGALLVAIVVGVAVSRLILRQLRALVATTRRLGAGDLSARAPVVAGDEHGELALAVNRMAEQLEAQHASLEAEVEQRTGEIRRLLRDRSEFFAGLSHELRTPLAVIATQAELMETYRKREHVSTASATIAAAAAQLIELVNDILDLAGDELGSVDIRLTPVDLALALEEITTLVSRLGSAVGVDVRISSPRRPLHVKADADRLRDVLVNVIGNAVKYTPAGGQVDVSIATRDGAAVIDVADTGIGIPDEIGDRVFEPFFRVPGARTQAAQSSSGLGLALARRWVRAFGGEVTWRPRGDAGTVFTLTIPLAE
jgi:signal transduction histidine kinase